VAGLVLVWVAWGSTRWLLGNVAYARATGERAGGLTASALVSYRAADRLAPYLSLAARGVAETALSLAASEPEPGRRSALLAGAGRALARARPWVRAPVFPWMLAGQVALARAAAGELREIDTARAAFAEAARQRPLDPRALTYGAMASLEADLPAQARALAARALGLDRDDWLAWAVLARASDRLGDATGAEQARMEARRAAPAEVGDAIERLVR
jgi:tetratricopeptide (TPR) repeat protein